MVNMSILLLALNAMLIIGVQCHQKSWSEKTTQEPSRSKGVQKNNVNLVYHDTSSSGQQTQKTIKLSYPQSSAQLSQNQNSLGVSTQNRQPVNTEKPSTKGKSSRDKPGKISGQWHPDIIQGILRKIREDDLSVKEAARLYQVPRRTLDRHVNRAFSNEITAGTSGTSRKIRGRRPSEYGVPLWKIRKSDVISFDESANDMVVVPKEDDFRIRRGLPINSQGSVSSSQMFGQSPAYSAGQAASNFAGTSDRMPSECQNEGGNQPLTYDPNVAFPPSDRGNSETTRGHSPQNNDEYDEFVRSLINFDNLDE